MRLLFVVLLNNALIALHQDVIAEIGLRSKEAVKMGGKN